MCRMLIHQLQDLLMGRRLLPEGGSCKYKGDREAWVHEREYQINFGIQYLASITAFNCRYARSS